ncbi:MAG TPA: cell envelope integrity EipB family protein [Xanthobacteraceae bacterium]
MADVARAMPVAAAISLLAMLAGNAFSFSGALAAEPQVELASHRAVYELKLAHSRGNSSTMSARGRILYDFSGNSCEGYALLFRQVSELDNGEGKVTLSDLRSTSWEEARANRFVFKSQNYLNENLLDTVDGEAQRVADKVQVTLTKPQERKFDIESAVAFPTDHMRRIIAAARQEKSILELPVYDGSEKGDKVFNTLSVIGRTIAPNERVPIDAAANRVELANLKRWPVTVSYFDKSAKTDQPPVYAIKFELYENGISRALVLDYNDFAISGELTSLDLREGKPCR